MPSEPHFSEPEVEAILARAIERAESGKAKLSLEDLVSVGAEVGVSRAAIESAAAEIMEEPASATASAAGPSPSSSSSFSPEDASLPGSELEAVRRRLRARWFSKLYVYLAVNVFLLFVNLMTAPEHLWVLWPVLGWGLAIVLGARRAFFMSEEELARVEHHRFRADNRRARKEARRQRKEARRARKRGNIPPIDDVRLRARIDARVDTVLAQRGVRVAAAEPERRRVQEEEEEEEIYEEKRREGRR